MGETISIHDLPEQDVLAIRAHRPTVEIPTFLGTSFEQLYGRLALLGATPAGPPFVIYHAFEPSMIDAEVCVPYAGTVASNGTVTTRHLPATMAARTLHVGPYDTIGGAYAAVEAWTHEHGYEPSGPVRECYLNGPGDGVSPAEYRTEVLLPIAPVAVGAGH
jgi:effector-binding domain-containing protein